MQRFFRLLQEAPFLEKFWDYDDRSTDLDALKEEMGAWSRGEIILAQFFAGLWVGNNTLEFDMFQAAEVLDANNRRIIMTWFEDPFWP